MSFQIINEFSIGDVLNHSIKIYFQKFIQLLIISTLINLPIYGFTLLYFDTTSKYTFESFEWSLSIIPLNILTSSLLISAIIMISFNTMRNIKTSIIDSLKVCFKYFFPVVIAGISMVALILVGYVLLIIPAFIALTRVFLTIPSVVVESYSPFGAISRSNQLSKGYRWSIFGLIIISGIINIGALQVLINLFLEESPSLYFNLFFLFSIIFTPFISIVQTVSYYHIRSVEEGVDIDQIAEIFN